MEDVREVLSGILTQSDTESARLRLEDLFEAFLDKNDNQEHQTDTVEIYRFKRELEHLFNVARKEYGLEKYDK